MSPPDFLVIGAYKSGTTALHHYLRAHPGLFVPRRKEPSYYAFADEVAPYTHPAAATSVRRLADYQALFAAAPAGRPCGEVSPAYLTVPSACDRIRREAPDAKLVAILRNPVERAYSDYVMYRRDGLEHEERFLTALHRQGDRDPAVDPTSRYIATGFYAAQLRPYLHAVPPEQIHVLLHEDLRDDRARVLHDLFAFLGVDPTVEIDEQAPSNVSGEPTTPALRLAYAVRRRVRALRPLVPERVFRPLSARLERGLVRTPLPADAATLLVDLYRDDVAELAILIGRDLSHWLDVPPGAQTPQG